MGRELKTRLEAQSKQTPGLYRGGEATELRVCSASAQALQGGSLNGLKSSLCSLDLRQLQSLQFPLAQFVELTVLSLCCKSSLIFSPTQSYCYPGKHLAVPFISSAMGSFSLSGQLLFILCCPFCSAWWTRYGTYKEIPAFGGWGGVSALQLHWFISEKWTEKD